MINFEMINARCKQLSDTEDAKGRTILSTHHLVS